MAQISLRQVLSNIFKPKQSKQDYTYAFTQNGTIPRFSNFGDNVYDSDTVQQCISAIAKEMKKLEPCHVKKKNELSTTIDDSINRVLHNPNPMMTTADFIEKCIWLLYLKSNCYIYPVYELKQDERTGRMYRDYKALYPLNPREITYWERDNDDGVAEIISVSFEVAEGKEVFVSYSEIIHLRLNFSLNDYVGGDKFGKPNNAALLTTLKINHKLLESLSDGIEGSQSFNGIVKYNTKLNEKAVLESVERLIEATKKSQTGVIGLDNSVEYIPLDRNIKIADKDTLEFLDKKTLRNYGVPQAILDGTATPEIKRAWYDTTLEPLITMFNQAFTKTLFTPYQKSAGNKVEFFYNRMETMTNAEIIEQAKILGERGAITNNQLLAMIGLPPYEGGDVRLQSLNYVDVTIANTYQLNNAKSKQQVDKVKEIVNEDATNKHTSNQTSETVSKEVVDENNT